MLRSNRIAPHKLTFLECSATPAPEDQSRSSRPDILFDDFERETPAPWPTEGTAFGRGPAEKSQVVDYQGDLAMQGQRAVNTHSAAPAGDVGGRDAHTGTLTSPSFTIERNYVRFLIGGGAHAGKTCVNLLVNDKVVLSATGANDNKMKPVSWGVRRWAGQTARIQAVDKETGGWGNIGPTTLCSATNRTRRPDRAEQPDFGTMVLALLGGSAKKHSGRAAVPGDSLPAAAFSGSAGDEVSPATKRFGEELIGLLSRRLSLKPGQTGEVTFALTWHFPNLKLPKLPPGRHYATRFPSALAAAEYLAANFERLASQTRLWHDTWYDSTLPFWFLDRAFLNTSILATSTCFRLGNGRFWGWEGVGCCEGTCGHVWQYAHAVARLFPQLERDTASAWTSASPSNRMARSSSAPSTTTSRHRCPGRHLLRVARTPDVQRRCVAQAQLARHSQSRRVAHREGRERRRPHRRQPAQHARHGLVRSGRVAERDVSRGVARR